MLSGDASGRGRDNQREGTSAIAKRGPKCAYACALMYASWSRGTSKHVYVCVPPTVSLVSTIPLRAQLGTSSVRRPAFSAAAPCLSQSMSLPPAAQVLCQVLVLHGLRVEQVLRASTWADVPRNLDCLEVFAGVGSVAAAAAELGLRSATYDKNRVPGNTERPQRTSPPKQGYGQPSVWSCVWHLLHSCGWPRCVGRGGS